MSDTPRTYAEIHSKDPCFSRNVVTVDANFACQLEMELNAANERIKLLEACNADVARIAGERNEALKRIRQLEKAGDGMVRWIENYGCKNEFYPAIEIWHKAKEAKP